MLERDCFRRYLSLEPLLFSSFGQEREELRKCFQRIDKDGPRREEPGGGERALLREILSTERGSLGEASPPRSRAALLDGGRSAPPRPAP